MMKKRGAMLLVIATIVLACLAAYAEDGESASRAASQFSKARSYFSEIADLMEGSVQKSAGSAAGSAGSAASAAEGGDFAGACSSANRAKLDAVIAAAAVNAHNAVDDAVRSFDAQVSAFESASAEGQAEALVKVAEKLAGLARALRDAVIG